MLNELQKAKHRAYMREYSKRPEVKARVKAYYKKFITDKDHRDKHNFLQRSYYRKRYKQRRAEIIERVRRRTDRIRGVNWLTNTDRIEIQKLYDFCKVNKGYEVDHIIPLYGERVSGLHVLSNLQVLPKRENRAKGSKWTQEN